MTRLWHWTQVLYLLSCLLSVSWATKGNILSFENTAIVRTVELGGSLVAVTTTYAIQAVTGDTSEYIVALSEAEHGVTSWIEATLKGSVDPLQLKPLGYKHDYAAHLYSITLPQVPVKGETTSLVLETVQTKATYPWPPSSPQGGEQLLKYESDLLVISPYVTSVQRTKVRGPASIRSFTTPEGLEAFTDEPTAVQAGSVVTYGPYKNIPASANPFFAEESQKRILIHYEFNEGVLTVVKLQRAAEISHWGSNLNIENQILLRNTGPTLKGHFSRLDHQFQGHYHSAAAQSIRSVPMLLPAGINTPYYYDLIGNVSTSRFRPSRSGKSRTLQFSYLDLRPRYPLLGGWNYSFTLGWDAPLSDSAKWDAKTGRYIIGVPYWTPITGSYVEEAEVKIVLPEGATDVEVFPPFNPLTVNRTVHTSYLDTTGRPAIILTNTRITDRHTGVIYVTYKVPFTAHLKKPIAVAAATFSVFVLALAARRVDPRIHK
ncbi:Ribophorin I [Sistotremastrum niveocremeum HHB9708]|uniref:Dolichyl-diphosphooligosaccharide--protein glycosyltransferase subunit 1 n=1 Tax=Sistotremastrum niveocremeum HHB9708 TaxID=1314777 RepID=A0A164S7M0_9AGAM|nr:Ribophorin I [Sistotremastrum niveocremeum HHB9708]